MDARNRKGEYVCVYVLLGREEKLQSTGYDETLHYETAWSPLEDGENDCFTKSIEKHTSKC